MYNLVGQQFYSLAIVQLHALSLLQKTVQIRDQFFLYMDPTGICSIISSANIIQPGGAL
jgi:hypothetical protein